jgi:uncharacterized membrane protein (UPF0127 family)
MRVKVQLPRTLEEGLAGQSPIKYPMLFEFPGKPMFRTMWMKGMLEPIDVVWLDTSKAIVGIHHHCPPGEQHTYSSGVPVKYAIEFPAGYAKQHKLAAGDVFDFDEKK